MELKELIRELNLQVPWENIFSCKEVPSGLGTHSHILRAPTKTLLGLVPNFHRNFQQLLLQQEQPGGSSGQQQVLQNRAGVKYHQILFRKTTYLNIYIYKISEDLHRANVKSFKQTLHIFGFLCLTKCLSQHVI